jgi:hypothetical protein
LTFDLFSLLPMSLSWNSNLILIRIGGPWSLINVGIIKELLFVCYLEALYLPLAYNYQLHSS